MVLNSQVDHGKTEHEPSHKQYPVGDEDIHVTGKMHASSKGRGQIRSSKATSDTYGVLTASDLQAPAPPAD